MRRALPVVLFACGPAFEEPTTPSNNPMTPDPAPSASSSSAAASASASASASGEPGEVQIGVGPIASAAPIAGAAPSANASPSGVPDIIHGAKPTIFSRLDVGPTPLMLHGYSDCHLGSGVEVRCMAQVDVDLLGRDKGPPTSAPSPKDIDQRAPTKVKLFRQSLCHDFYVKLSAPKATKCDVAVHAVIYPD